MSTITLVAAFVDSDSSWQQSSNDKKNTYKRALIESWCREKVGELSDVPAKTGHITSQEGYNVLGTFNTIRDEGTVAEAERRTAVHIPGAPALWRTPPYPFRIPDTVKDGLAREPLRFGVGDKVDKYLWKVPLHAIEICSPDFDLRGVDVMITAKRLEAFWKYCSGSGRVEVLANATVMHNTLFVDGFDPVGLEFGKERDAMTRFAYCATSWPYTQAHSLHHFRVVRYRLGRLNIVVVCGVDAAVSEEHNGDCTARVTLFDPIIPRDISSSWAGIYQGWLRRCPYLVFARQESGAVQEEHIRYMGKIWKQWELSDHSQASLQRMAVLLERLRDMLRSKAPEQSCVVMKTNESEKENKSPSPIRANPSDTDKGKDYIPARKGPAPKRIFPLQIWKAGHGRYPLPPEESRKLSRREPEIADRTAPERQEKADQGMQGLADAETRACI